MKISKAVSSVIVAGMLLTGWSNSSNAMGKKENSDTTKAVKEVPAGNENKEGTMPAGAVCPKTGNSSKPANADIPSALPEGFVCPNNKKDDAAVTVPAAAENKVENAPANTESKETVAPTVVSKEGLSVADLFAKKDELNGKSVTIHGKVAKISLGIMGKNWIHLQDGTGSAGTNDITVTTDGEAKVADKVVITGTVVTNKDFGAGYKYSVIIENATVTAE